MACVRLPLFSFIEHFYGTKAALDLPNRRFPVV